MLPSYLYSKMVLSSRRASSVTSFRIARWSAQQQVPAHRKSIGVVINQEKRSSYSFSGQKNSSTSINTELLQARKSPQSFAQLIALLISLFGLTMLSESRAASLSEDVERFLTANQIEASETPHPNVAGYSTNSIQANKINEDSMVCKVQSDFAYFAVFDGHTGEAASRFMRDKFFSFALAPFIAQALETCKKKHLPEEKGIMEAIDEAFLRADEHFLKSNLEAGNIDAGLSGACSLIVYIRNNVLYVANAGDCRAVLATKEEESNSVRSVALSRDHSIASNPAEAARLQLEHPNDPDILKRNRVKGFLEPTRGIGDGRYKMFEYNELSSNPRPNWEPPYTTAQPDIRMREISPNDEFVVLATDGLWGFFDSDHVVKRIHELHTQNPPTKHISTVLLRDIFSTKDFDSEIIHQDPKVRRRHYDDTSIIVIYLKTDPTKKLKKK